MTDLVAFDDKLAKRTKRAIIKLILEILKEALINDKLRKHT